MGGIYIHIPFCKQACTYCNFHFSTSLRLKSSLIDSLCREIETQHGFFDEENIETIYFGGGTPSLLEERELDLILQSIHSNFNIAGDAELTLEANPDDICIQKLQLFRALGINRLSIGVQSFFDEDLAFMNRAHNSREAIECLEISVRAGIDNINIDLIYGTPTLPDDNWRANLEKVADLGIPHLSAYQLTVEPGTALASHIKKGKLPPLPEDNAVRQFEILTDWAAQNQFDHYEISNLSKPGSRSRHNTSYWHGKSYLGVGPAAHSFKGNMRRWNIANNAIYIKKVGAGESAIAETEILSLKDQYNEYVMTGLRLSDGVNANRIIEFGNEYIAIFKGGIAPHIATGKAVMKNGQYRLSETGRIFADRIASDCFWV